jgi:hypothetical protein
MIIEGVGWFWVYWKENGTAIQLQALVFHIICEKL